MYAALRLMTPGLATSSQIAPSKACRARWRKHARGAMLGLALGDALGATVEFMMPREIRAQFGVHDRIRGGGWLRLASGSVTDDTTMALALGNAWLDAAPYAPTEEDYARAFDTWMRSKPVDIGNTVRRGIAHFRRTGTAWITPSEDAGNGATMRCTPTALALLGAPPDTTGRATLAQARVTHYHPFTDAATLTVVNMVQAGLADGGIRAIMAQAHLLVQAFPQFKFRTRPIENPSGYIVDTMRAVLQAIDLCDNFESAVVDVVNRGGDADTTGAIVGTIMGALYGEDALPARWLRDLDNKVYRRCIDQADRLIERSPAWSLGL